MPITGTSRPALWKLARLDFDPVRHRAVLLYPEGALLLSDTAGEILALCDGRRTVADIAATLGSKYEADVMPDVIDYLDQLAERELVRDVT
ncbi:MAG TPA: pyrroloquinoline quinone biosynthesis peptide chaperone PqqD [Gemmatimonadaceae bacterium]|nr:pyrroloquinoline quinone biosynthesis peptide chaperone PqqD [Gemmatimonadaceae bacterium]